MCASPQKENGFTPIANEIMDALGKIALSPYENQMLHIILRHTYGYQRKIWQLKRWKELEDKTGIGKTNIQRTLRKLEHRNMIKIDYEKKDISFLKDYERWQKVIQTDNKKVIQTDNKKVIQTDNKKLSKQITQVIQTDNFLTFENGIKPLADKTLEGVSFLPKEKKERKKENFKEISLAKSVQGQYPGAEKSKRERERIL